MMFCPNCGHKIEKSLSKEAKLTLAFMHREAPKRGGFIFEKARYAFENGNYHIGSLKELLEAGLIAPHSDPNKGWIVL